MNSLHAQRRTGVAINRLRKAAAFPARAGMNLVTTEAQILKKLNQNGRGPSSSLSNERRRDVVSELKIHTAEDSVLLLKWDQSIGEYRPSQS